MPALNQKNAAIFFDLRNGERPPVLTQKSGQWRYCPLFETLEPDADKGSSVFGSAWGNGVLLRLPD
jgi:hypothetical protein